MNTRTMSRFVLLFLCYVGITASLPNAEATPLVVPANLAVKTDQEVALILTAKGVQIYECRPVGGDPAKFAWVFKAPEADLFDAAGRKAGRHYAGPTWELADGSKVTGRVLTKADSPGGKGVPWLLLEATGNAGTGALDRVRSIQRIDTAGGNPPAEPAGQTTAGQERRVDYTATYVFYAAKP